MSKVMIAPADYHDVRQAIQSNQVVQDLIHSWASVYPHVDDDLCTACETCIEQCPVANLPLEAASKPRLMSDSGVVP